MHLDAGRNPKDGYAVADHVEQVARSAVATCEQQQRRLTGNDAPYGLLRVGGTRVIGALGLIDNRRSHAGVPDNAPPHLSLAGQDPEIVLQWLECL